MKLYQITTNKSGKVRDKLCLEDIGFTEWKMAEGFGLVKLLVIDNERVLWFKDGIRVPKFNKFYASRISDTSDPYLYELISRLLYLNPNPDKLGIKKITEFIVLRFSRMEMRESEVLDKKVPKPVLTFEQVEHCVNGCVMLSKLEKYQPENEVPVLFQRDSEFTREQKIKILSEYRGKKAKELLENAIHVAAEHLIDTKEYFKITNSKLRETGIVQTEKGLASINTITKYMNLRTKKVIDEHNEVAPFKSKKAAKLYREFLELPEDSTLDEYSSKLSISKSTAVEFKRLSEYIK